MNKTDTKQRLFVVIPLAITLALVVLFAYLHRGNNQTESEIAEKDQSLITANKIAFSIVSHYYSLQSSGKLSPDSAQLAALNILSNIQISPEFQEYSWILNYDGDILSHPYFESGTNLLNYQSLKGEYPVQLIIESTNTKDEGFVDYSWQWKDDSSRVENKKAYVTKFKPWHWIIGSSYYTASLLEKQYITEKNLLIKTSVLLALIFTLIAISLGTSLSVLKKNRLAREKINKEREQFRALAENIASAVIIYDEQKLVFINKRVREIFGLGNEPIESFNVFQFLEDNERKRIEITYQAVDLNLFPFNELTLLIKTYKQELKTIRAKFHTIRLQSGREYRYIICSDITDDIATKENLRKLSESVTQSPSSIVITNHEGLIEYVNPRFEENTGYSATEIMGKKPSILKSGKMPDTVFKDMWQQISNGNEWKGELLNRKKNGDLFWEATVIAPIVDAYNDITHYVAVKHDITGQKNLEQELVKAKERAEESDKIKTAFLSNMSHEIRTPLNAIVGFSDLLLRSKSNEVKQEFAYHIHTNSEALIKIIDDILDFAKLEAQKINVRLKPFELVSFLIELKRLFEAKENQENNNSRTFICSIPENTDKYYLISDNARLRQVFVNLLSNAVKYTDNGNITFGFKETANDELTFFVKDEGIGISAEDLEVIFDRFEHGTSKYVSLHKGTGLGLTIAKHLVEIMGGKIWVDSEPGNGATFNFTHAKRTLTQQDLDNQLAHPKEFNFNFTGKSILYFSAKKQSLIEGIFSNTHAGVVYVSAIDTLTSQLEEKIKPEVITLEYDLLTERIFTNILPLIGNIPLLLISKDINQIPSSIINGAYRTLSMPANPIDILSNINELMVH